MIRVKKNCGSSPRSRWCSVEQVCQEVKCTIKRNPDDCIVCYIRTYLFCRQKMAIICCTAVHLLAVIGFQDTLLDQFV